MGLDYMPYMTMPAYFSKVRFTELTRLSQIEHILFYVTCIAELRRDMVPEIIAHRINDQIKEENSRRDIKTYHQSPQYTLVDVSEIAQICEENVCKPDKEKHIQYSTYRDNTDRQDVQHLSISERPKEKRPYMLTPETKKKLLKEFEQYSKSVIAKQNSRQITIVSIITCLVLFLLSLSLLLLMNTSSKPHDLSWESYKDRMNFHQSEPGMKAIYLLNYITNIIKFREDMTPDVIAARLAYQGYKNINEQQVKEYFENSDLITASSSREGAFQLSPVGHEILKNKILLQYPQDASLAWLIMNVPLSSIIALGTLLLSALSLGFFSGRLKSSQTT